MKEYGALLPVLELAEEYCIGPERLIFSGSVDVALLEKEPTDERALADVLFRYHRGICLRSGNEFFPLLLNEFRPIIMEFWLRSVRVFGAASNVHLAKRYLELIRAGDAEGAFRRLERSVNEYLSCLDEQ